MQIALAGWKLRAFFRLLPNIFALKFHSAKSGNARTPNGQRGAVGGILRVIPNASIWRGDFFQQGPLIVLLGINLAELVIDMTDFRAPVSMIYGIERVCPIRE